MPLRKMNSEKERVETRPGSFLTLRDEVNHLFNDFISDPAWPMRVAGADTPMDFTPSVDIRETEIEYKIKAETPGMGRNKIKLSVENNALIIKGEKKEGKEQQKGSYSHMERSFGRFYRSIPFTSKVDGEHVCARYSNGVLSVTVPKSDKAISSKIRILVEESN